jgi:hypothetical protein
MNSEESHIVHVCKIRTFTWSRRYQHEHWSNRLGSIGSIPYSVKPDKMRINSRCASARGGGVREKTCECCAVYIFSLNLCPSFSVGALEPSEAGRSCLLHRSGMPGQIGCRSISVLMRLSAAVSLIVWAFQLRRVETSGARGPAAIFKRARIHQDADEFSRQKIFGTYTSLNPTRRSCADLPALAGERLYSPQSGSELPRARGE